MSSGQTLTVMETRMAVPIPAAEGQMTLWHACDWGIAGFGLECRVPNQTRVQPENL